MRFPIFTFLSHVLFPVRCTGCKIPGVALCTHCIARIPFASDLPEKTYAVFDYGHPLVRSAIRTLKYRRRSEAAHALATAALPHLIEYVSGTLQTTSTSHLMFIPIPTYAQRAREKGFNQSTLLADWWHTELLHTELIPHLKKVTATRPQAGLSRRARLHNVAHTMQCKISLDPKAIYIIIDDVITTGATCAEARRALRAAGARKIVAVALAHGYART